jgi:hypothetical protein
VGVRRSGHGSHSHCVFKSGCFYLVVAIMPGCTQVLKLLYIRAIKLAQDNKRKRIESILALVTGGGRRRQAAAGQAAAWDGRRFLYAIANAQYVCTEYCTHLFWQWADLCFICFGGTSWLLVH